MKTAPRKLIKIKEQPPRFNALEYHVSQRFTTSFDGTRIPYYLVAPKNIKLDGNNPTCSMPMAVRGFLLPNYLSLVGKNWLEKGGIYVLANIRGGSEYGPVWHSSVLKENRHKIFEDFYTVIEDLFRQRSPPLVIWGFGAAVTRAAGGHALTQRPELSTPWCARFL